MFFRQLFDAESSTYTYLLADEKTRDAVIIDPVNTQHERDATLIRELELKLVFAVDTHVHADHVTGLGLMRDAFRCKTGLSMHGATDCPDRLFHHGDEIIFGEYALDVIETPGHTNGCVSYATRDRAMVFTGDALLIRGCGRTDFQQGDARTLWRSVHEKLFVLPAATLVYPGHDYKGRTASSIGEEKRLNPRLGGMRTCDEFIKIMAELALAPPSKIDIALPANLQCGRLPS